MFPNKFPLGRVSKFSKCKFESRPDAVLRFFGGRTATRSNSPKMSVLRPAESNGFRGEFALARKLPGVIRTGRSFSEASKAKCWKCKKDLEVRDFSCASCGALQRPNANANYFQLLGVSQMYEIDLEELSKKFRNMQMVFHPDKFANKSMEELEISESYSRLLNKAYSTLKDPIRRGFYLLELQKISPEKHPLQQDFLMQVMERNEELDSIDKQSVLAQFTDKNNEAIETQMKLIKEAFRSSQVENAKDNLLKLNYYMNLDAKIKEKQNALNSPPDTS